MPETVATPVESAQGEVQQTASKTPPQGELQLAVQGKGEGKEVAHSPEEKKAEVQKLRLALEGTEREYTVDELRANFLKGKSSAQLLSKADQKLREAERREAKLESLKQRLGRRDFSALAELAAEAGVDPVEAAAEILRPQIEAMEMTEEQRKVAEAERRAAAYQRRLQEIEDQQKQAKIESDIRQQVEEFGARFTAALDELKLPKHLNSMALGRMAHWQSRAIEVGKEYTPKELAEIVVDELGESYQRAVPESGAALYEWLGKKRVDELMREVIRRKQESLPPGAPPIASFQPRAQEAAIPRKHGQTRDEYLDDLARRLG